MAAEVSSLIRILNAADSNDSGKSTALITRDLLGGGCPLDSKELDLDMQVPSGWEKRLDLKVSSLFSSYSSPSLQFPQNIQPILFFLKKKKKINPFLIL